MSRCQWIQSSDVSSSWCNQDHGDTHPVGHSMILEAQHSRGVGGHSTIPRLIQACSHRGCLLRAVSAMVAALGLLWLRLLAQACSFRGLWFRPAPVKVIGSALLPQRSLIHALQQRSLDGACSLRGGSLVPSSAEISE